MPRGLDDRARGGRLDTAARECTHAAAQAGTTPRSTAHRRHLICAKLGAVAVPSLYSITPTSGHSGGGQLLQVFGSGFNPPGGITVPPRRVHGPWSTPNPGVAPPPPPTMQVLFSTYTLVPNPGGGPPLLEAGPQVPATNVAVISTGILTCTTPVAGPTGIPWIAPTPNRAGQIAIPASDVTVLNMDPYGVPIPGETAVLPESYSFLRPDFTVPGVAATVIGALILDLQRQILPNVEFNPHTDYDATSGDFLNIAFPSALPGLAIMNLKMPQAEGRPRSTEEEVTFTTASGYTFQRLSVLRDLVFTVLGVSDNQSELLGIAEAMEVYFRRCGGITVPADTSNPTGPTVTLPFYRETDNVFTGRVGVSNVVAFTFTIRVVGVPFADMPGLAPDAQAIGTSFSGASGVQIQSTR